MARAARASENGVRYETSRLVSPDRWISSSTPPAVSANRPPTPARIASANRQTRMASDKSRLGSVKPQIPADAATISAAGEISRASTAVVPTASPPMIDTAVPMACGRWSPASCSSSKAASRPMTSKTVSNGTSCLESMMASRSLVGIIS